MAAHIERGDHLVGRDGEWSKPKCQECGGDRYTCKVSGSWVGCTEGTCDPIPRMMTPEPPLTEADHCPVHVDAPPALESSGEPLAGAQGPLSEVRHLRPEATADTLRGRDA